MAGENKWEQMRAATQAGEVSPWVTLWPPSRRVHSPQGMQGTKAKARLCFGPCAENIETTRDGQKTLLESEDLDRTLTIRVEATPSGGSTTTGTQF